MLLWSDKGNPNEMKSITLIQVEDASNPAVHIQRELVQAYKQLKAILHLNFFLKLGDNWITADKLQLEPAK